MSIAHATAGVYNPHGGHPLEGQTVTFDLSFYAKVIRIRRRLASDADQSPGANGCPGNRDRFAAQSTLKKK